MDPRSNIHHRIVDTSIKEVDVAIKQSAMLPAEVNAVLKCIARALGRIAAREQLATQNSETLVSGLLCS